MENTRRLLRNSCQRLPQPRSLDRNALARMNPANFWVADKTDGVRKMLVCIDDKVFWWDRRQEDTIIKPIQVAPNLYVGTVLDGELVADTTFVVFDCYAITGTNVCRRPLPIRLNHARTVARLLTLPNVKIIVKAMVPAVHAKVILHTHVPYPTDGLIFTPVNDPVQFGTNNAYKWKSPRMHTADFKLRATGDDVFALYASDCEKPIDFTKPQGILLVACRLLPADTVVECHFANNRWSIIQLQDGRPKVRADKTTANSLHVVQKTRQAVMDNLQLDDVIETLAR